MRWQVAQGLYALDITDPTNITENNASSVVLWEFTDEDDPDLGYTFSKPIIVRMANERWAAIVGNGYNSTEMDGNVSTTGNAVLFIIDIETGEVIKKIDTGIGTSADPLGLGRPNGLATPTVVDSTGDFIADYIYVGDLFGNLWKIDVADTNPNRWDVLFQGDPLFVAQRDQNDPTTRQAITTPPNVSKLSKSADGFIVLFGTGKYLEANDKTDMSIQSFYGLADRHTDPIDGRRELVEQSILSEQTVTPTNGDSFNARVTSNRAMPESKRGWYIDLVYNNNPIGERQITRSLLRFNRIIFTTMIPSSDPCGFGGTGWLMELDAQSGSRLTFSPFDINSDNQFTTADEITFNNRRVTLSGKQSSVGIISTPGVISSTDIEYKYSAGTSGQIEMTKENPGISATGRQSWRQLR